MSSTANLNLQTEKEQILEKIREKSINPFLQQIVQRAWDDPVNSDQIHPQVKSRIRQLIESCKKEQTPKCLTISGPKGAGKTHLLSYARQLCLTLEKTQYLDIPPYFYRTSSYSLEYHLLDSVLIGICDRNPALEREFESRVRDLFVECHDEIVAGNDPKLKELLSSRSGIIGSIFRGRQPSLRGQRLAEIQKECTRLLTNRPFLDFVFDRLKKKAVEIKVPPVFSRDAFVAICLKFLGDPVQESIGNQWFSGSFTSEDDYRNHHLDQPGFKGMDNLSRFLQMFVVMTGWSFCLAFDQIEDTYSSFELAKSDRTVFNQSMSTLLSQCSDLRGVCFIFSFQVGTYQVFAREISVMARDRLTEGYGVQKLENFSDEAALDVVSARMNKLLWPELGIPKPLYLESFFPFEQSDIRAILSDLLREASEIDVRRFLVRCYNRFEEIVRKAPGPIIGPGPGPGPIQPPPPPPFEDWLKALDAAKIREFRSRLRLTQRKIQEDTGIASTTVAKLERGNITGDPKRLLLDAHKLISHYVSFADKGYTVRMIDFFKPGLNLDLGEFMKIPEFELEMASK
jgi:DNA-binding XRE family transcriptional regulator